MKLVDISAKTPKDFIDDKRREKLNNIGVKVQTPEEFMTEWKTNSF